MTKLDLACAQKIIASALSGERSAPERHIAIAVCDAYGKPTDRVREWAEAAPIWFQGVSDVAQQTMGMPMIGSKGGIAIVDGAGNILGAVGIAGEAGEFDEALAVRGIESAGLGALGA